MIEYIKKKKKKSSSFRNTAFFVSLLCISADRIYYNGVTGMSTSYEPVNLDEPRIIIHAGYKLLVDGVTIAWRGNRISFASAML